MYNNRIQKYITVGSSHLRLRKVVLYFYKPHTKIYFRNLKENYKIIFLLAARNLRKHFLVASTMNQSVSSLFPEN